MSYLSYHLKHGLNKIDKELIYLDETWAQNIDATYYAEIANMKATNGKLTRNEPCYCGSNIKFKNCHGKNN